MTTSQKSGDSIRRYIHTCKKCQKKFKVVLDTSIYSIHQANCPGCNRLCHFDNRNGILDLKNKTNPTARSTRPATTPASDIGIQQRREITNPGSIAPTLANRPPTLAKSGSNSSPSTRLPQSSSANIAAQNLTRSTQARTANTQVAQTSVNSGTAQSASNRNKRPKRSRKTSISVFDRVRSKLGYATRNLSLPASATREGWLKLVAVAGVAACLFVFLLFASLRFPAFYLTASPESYLQKISGTRTNQILDRKGHLIGELFQKKTGNIQADQMPEKMAATLVFVEDTNFHNHSGIQWTAIMRAFIKNLFSFGYSQGGSTLTQQLARILLSDRDKNILRKLRETSLAYYIEDTLSKDEILAAYMSQVYLGHGSLGFDNAARFYFDKKLTKLNFSERLTLASLPSAPERYSPLRNPDLLLVKMNAVFERMQDEGFKTPSEVSFKQESRQLFEGLNKSPSASIFGSRVNDAPYVSEHIRLTIKKILGKEYQYGAGLRIETTIDRDLQRKAVMEIKKHVSQKAAHFPPVIMRDDKIIRRFGSSKEESFRREFEAVSLGPLLFGLSLPEKKKPRLQVAAIGIESRTGQIMFMQGGSDFGSNNQLNRTIQMRRQTGSSIKPIVYSAAIESGSVHVATMLEDRPIFVAGGGSKKGYWLPGNYSGVYEGEISVRRAMAKSQNIPAIQVLRAAGLERVSLQFKKFFFPKESVYKRRFRKDETVAIGSLEMSPLEMATAFSAFGNNGVIIRPYLIKRILGPDGAVLYHYKKHDEFSLQIPVERKVIRPDAAHIMVSMMKDSARFGGVSRGGFHKELIGKTGTSNQYRDTWFVGATPSITTAVWVGYDNPGYSMYHGTGAGLAGPLWGRIMRHAPTLNKGFYFKPNAVKSKVCADTGRKPSSSCSRVIKELFLKDRLPHAAKLEDNVRKNTQDVIDTDQGDESDFD